MLPPHSPSGWSPHRWLDEEADVPPSYELGGSHGVGDELMSESVLRAGERQGSSAFLVNLLAPTRSV